MGNLLLHFSSLPNSTNILRYLHPFRFPTSSPVEKDQLGKRNRGKIPPILLAGTFTHGLYQS